MNKETEEKLFKECPNLFKFYNIQGPPYWPIKFGFETKDGWNNIISNLCYKAEEIIKQLPEEEQKESGVIQIKEKFGGLRFYMYYPRELNTLTNLIKEAEELSFKTCEQCGKEGKLILTKRKWYLTLCPEHEAKVNS